MDIAVKPEISYTATGTTDTYSFPFDYLRKAFVKVKLDDTETTAFTIESKTVVFTTAPEEGTSIYIYRSTPTTRLVSWADASVLKAANMTIQQVQELHILEEQQVWQEGAYQGAIDTLNSKSALIDNLIPQATQIYNDTVLVQNKVIEERNTVKEYKDAAETYKNNAAVSAKLAQDNALDAGSKAETIESYYINATEAYSATKQYSIGDLVFMDNGDLYRALADNVGQNPTSSTVWVKVQNSLLTTFEMDASGDLMPRVNPQSSAIWDLDENGDIAPTAYGSGDVTHSANEQIIENQRNIAKLDNTKANKTDVVDAYNKTEIDTKVSELNSDIANRLEKNQGAENSGKYLNVGDDGKIICVNKNFEFCGNVILSESSSEVIFNDLSLKDVMAVVTFPNAFSGQWILIQVYYNKFCKNVISGNDNDTYIRCFRTVNLSGSNNVGFLKTNTVGNLVNCEISLPTTNYGLITGQSVDGSLSSLIVDNDAKIVKVIIQKQKPFDVDTKIVLYGVKI